MHILVWRMAGHIFCVGKKNNPPAVRRRMREPVAVVVGCDLFLFRAVGFHPPDLHSAGPLGIEINIFPVRRIIRAVVQTGRGGQACFPAAVNGNRVNVELTVSFGAISERFAIRRPAVPIRWRLRRDPDAAHRPQSAKRKCATCRPGSESLMASCVPSGEMPWSLLQWIWLPVSSGSDAPPVTGIW